MSWLSSIFKKGNKVKTKVFDPTPYEIISKTFFADISHHEDTFKINEYKKYYKLLVHKTTQSISMIDEFHLPRKTICENNGVKYIGYHFYQCYVDPIKQAKFYVEKHGAFNGINPIVDFETEGKKQTDADLKNEEENFYLCLKEVQILVGLTPVIYANLLTLQRLQLNPKFAEFFIWPARYNGQMMFVPYPWNPEKLVGWQYSDGGETYSHPSYQNSFQGIGNCDSNIYNEKIDLFKLL